MYRRMARMCVGVATERHLTPLVVLRWLMKQVLRGQTEEQSVCCSVDSYEIGFLPFVHCLRISEGREPFERKKGRQERARRRANKMATSITEYNGGSVMAMAGDGCVAVVSDLRLGQQGATVACDWSKVMQVHPRLLVGLAGLGTDVLSLQQRLRTRHTMYTLREGRNMRPTTFGRFLSNLLYQGRFGPYFCEPVVAGLEADGSPYIAGMDLIGAM